MEEKKKKKKKSSTSTLDVQQHLDLHSWPASVPLGSIAFAVWQQCPRNMWQRIWTLVQQEKLKTGVQLSSFRVVQQTSRDVSLIRRSEFRNSNPTTYFMIYIILKKSLRSDTACGYSPFFDSYAENKKVRERAAQLLMSCRTPIYCGLQMELNLCL